MEVRCILTASMLLSSTPFSRVVQTCDDFALRGSKQIADSQVCSSQSRSHRFICF